MELILLLVFCSIAALVAAVASFARSPEQERLMRLSRGATGAKPDDSESVLTQEGSSWVQRLVGLFVGSYVLDRENPAMAPLRQRLAQAGYRREDAPLVFVASRMVLGLALPVVFLLLPLAWTLSELQLVTALFVAAGVGFLAPRLWLDRTLRARQQAVELALPDALDLMVVCVEAGLGINASLRRIARDFEKTHPVLASEFALTNFEMGAGKSTGDALRGLADRTGVPDVGTLVAMLIQTERFGTGLADTLRVHADGMRVRRLQRAEEAANKVPLRMLGPTALIFVAILLLIVGPGILQMSSVLGNR